MSTLRLSCKGSRQCWEKEIESGGRSETRVEKNHDFYIKKSDFFLFKSDLFDFLEIWYIDIYIDV